jgi:hypothetical protein
VLQGLPFSNEVCWWSRHSGNSTSCSSSLSTSYVIPPSGSSSSTMGVSSCNPVWCIRVCEYMECTWYGNDIWWTWVFAYEWTLLLLFYRVGADLLFSYYSHNKQDMQTYTQVNQSNILVAYVNFKLCLTTHAIRSQISPKHVKVPWMTYINFIKLYLASILKRT